MVTMAQSNTHTHVDRMHSLTHLIYQHGYNDAVRSASSATTEFGINFFILKVPEGGWNKPEYPEKPPR